MNPTDRAFAQLTGILDKIHQEIEGLIVFSLDMTD